MSLDLLYWQQYQKGSLTCWDFVVSVWKELTGVDLSLVADFPEGISLQMRFWKNQKNRLIRLEEPKDPCIVFLLNAKRNPHVGVYNKRRILHLDENGPTAQTKSTVSMFYNKMEFYDAPTTDQ
jgi:hypothetical protein